VRAHVERVGREGASAAARGSRRDAVGSTRTMSFRSAIWTTLRSSAGVQVKVGSHYDEGGGWMVSAGSTGRDAQQTGRLSTVSWRVHASSPIRPIRAHDAVNVPGRSPRNRRAAAERSLDGRKGEGSKPDQQQSGGAPSQTAPSLRLGRSRLFDDAQRFSRPTRGSTSSVRTPSASFLRSSSRST
jgi:hypothetical protein